MALTIQEVLNYSNPLEYADSPDSLSSYSDMDYVREWERGSFFAQMLDMWGEVKRALDCRGDASSLSKQLEAVRTLCTVLYAEDAAVVSPGEKWEMKVAEWMLYDYLIGGNSWGQSEHSAIGWWYSMSHGINYALV